MRIPFDLQDWLKDKSQKIETRDGRIVHNIWSIKEPFYTNNKKAEVCALIDGEEDALVFFEGGRYLPTTQDTDSPFDLFIVTPEPELSEFESKVKCIVDNLTNNITYRNVMKERFNREDEDEQIKEYASELLAIARKEIVHNIADSGLDSLAHKIGYQKGFEAGKAEALKDLPRWRKWGNGACGNRQGVPLAIVKRVLNGYELVDALGIQGEQYIMLSDLEKLPGFNENEK